ncbi:MAG: PSD1 and planctomycete cytochrome C domain-containing protein [Planctomycetaceae bacterium]
MAQRAPRLFFATLFVTCIVVSAASTVVADDVESAEQIAYFEKHVRPLLIQRCYECHSKNSDTADGGLLLDTKSGWVTGGDQGAAIVPGDVEASLLIRAVRYSDPDLRMPPSAALPAEEVAYLERWVAMGAIDPRTESETDEPPKSDPSDPVAGRQHWAFQPLNVTSPPSVQSADWPVNDIDRFVLAGLESAALKPAADAPPRTIARRLYFQLTGMPPTPEQMQTFLDDQRPDAVEHLVDRLLNSPQYGERWGRHWMDLARFADSNGLDENFLFREAWHYRNWVIDAVNNDMPFDRFVLEQIAGDLLPYDSIEQRDSQRIATGFIVVGPKVLLGSDPQQQRMDIADELIDTIGKTFLAQTLGCARCHNHKFDPFPTADYYALAGIFTSTEVVERRYMLGEQRVMERLTGLGPEGEDLDAAYEKYWRDRKSLQETAKQAKTALDLLKNGDLDAVKALAEKSGDAVAEGVLDKDQPAEQRVAAQQKLADEIAHMVANPPPIPPRAMIAADRDKPADEYIRVAGVFDSKGDLVPRGFLRVVGDDEVAIPGSASGRVELAEWLTDTDSGAGQLAARVLVNRVWHHVMGRGIVRTVDNFGRTGESPSHPELLDYLASQLIRSGWSLKSVVRSVVLCRANRMGTDFDETAFEIDPENRLLWRFNRRRLDPESMRDAMLSAAGTLDPAPMDSTVWYLGDQATSVGDNKNRRRTDFPCRSVYLPVIRNDLPEIFDAFDFADPHATTGSRPRTTVATQGLFILNSELVMDAAATTAERILKEAPSGDPYPRVERMFELIVNRVPTDEEQRAVVDFVSSITTADADQSEISAEESEQRAWSRACHALFASSRFQYLE